MAKKAQPKTSPKKAVAKAPTRKPAAASKGASKYDQPGAPWWKKYSPLEPGKTGV
ncbi:MAG TPA: hypothetical protein VN812_03330 [Candidatus Acidoferrales bacterium]|jgi:hypothetical protein|nr:hypothetical protein [Candidatus Acidoferrales bacterium]